MAPFSLTSNMVFGTLYKLYTIGGHSPVSIEDLIIALKQDGHSDDYTGTLEMQVDTHLRQLLKDHRVVSPRPGFFIPAGSLPQPKAPAFDPDKQPYPMTPPFFPRPPAPWNPGPSYPPWNPRPPYQPWEMPLGQCEDEPSPGINMSPLQIDQRSNQASFESPRQPGYVPSGQTDFKSPHLGPSSQSSSYTDTMLTTTVPSNSTDMPSPLRPITVAPDRFQQFLSEAEEAKVAKKSSKKKSDGKDRDQ